MRPEIIKNKNFFYYKCNNQFKKGVIIFVHGFSSSYFLHSGFFIFNKSKLKEYDYFSLNFVGHEITRNKNNTKLFEYDVYKYVDQLVDAIEKYKFDNIILIGHSMGGGISLLVKNKLQSKIKKIILVSAINPAIYFSHVGLKYLINTFQNLRLKIKEIEIDEKYLAKNKFNELIDEYLNYEIDRFLYMKRKYLFLGIKLLSPILYKKLHDEYKNIDIPVLFIIGEKDKVIPKKMTIKYLNSLKNKNIKTIVIKGSKHICFVEQFDDYNKYVWEFIENN